MGGKLAQERRRLKRLEDQQKKDASSSTVGAGNSTPTKAGVAASSGRHNNVKQQNQRHNNNNYQHSKRDNNTYKHDNSNNKRKFNNKAAATTTTTTNSHKRKKPKHLKRKLEQAIEAKDESQQKSVEEAMTKLQNKKAMRNESFEKKLRAMAGDKFDEEAFEALKGGKASKATLLTAVGAKTPAEGTTAGKYPSFSKKSHVRRDNSSAGVVKTNGAPKDNSTAEGKDTSEKKQPIDDSIPAEKGSSVSSSSIHKESKSITDENLKPVKGGETKPTASAVQSDSNSKDEEMEDNTAATVTTDDDDDDKAEHTNSKLSSSSDDSDSDNDDDDDDATNTPKRTRGRGRKDRREADSKRDALDREKQATAAAAAKAASEKKNAPRRCLGRKALTDFQLGSTYEGKVVYTKPFGVFIDINCHADAFCHVSRLRDYDYVSNVEDVVKAGDVVQARIVEINRRKKRITVSLQSEARIEDERKSAQDMQDREEKRRRRNGSGGGSSSKQALKTDEPTISTTKPSLNDLTSTPIATTPAPVVVEETAATTEGGNLAILQAMNESVMTPAQIKRLRKLERRAERREQQSLTGIAS